MHSRIRRGPPLRCRNAFFSLASRIEKAFLGNVPSAHYQLMRSPLSTAAGEAATLVSNARRSSAGGVAVGRSRRALRAPLDEAGRRKGWNVSTTRVYLGSRESRSRRSCASPPDQPHCCAIDPRSCTLLAHLTPTAHPVARQSGCLTPRPSRAGHRPSGRIATMNGETSAPGRGCFTTSRASEADWMVVDCRPSL